MGSLSVGFRWHGTSSALKGFIAGRSSSGGPLLRLRRGTLKQELVAVALQIRRVGRVGSWLPTLGSKAWERRGEDKEEDGVWWYGDGDVQRRDRRKEV